MTVAVGALGLVWGPLLASAQVSYREVALEGMAMPGLNGAEAWQFGPAKINSAGDVAFETVLQGAVDVTNDESIWVATDEKLRLIAREGDAWSGGSAGLVLGAIQPF
jgi:hypothetical protein